MNEKDLKSWLVCGRGIMQDEELHCVCGVVDEIEQDADTMGVRPSDQVDSCQVLNILKQSSFLLHK